MEGNGGVDWHITGKEVGSCSCDWGCPCQFEGDPTHGYCRVLIGYEINEGHFADTDIGGVRFAELIAFPGPIYEGNGTVQLVVDEEASPEQREAIEQIVSGEHGGTYFEVFASVLPNRHETVTAPIEITPSIEGRKGTVRVGDLGETAIEPIKSPVDGSEHRVRIDLPNGFEYKIAEIANATSTRVSGEDPLSFEFEQSYAQLNEFDWSPAA